MSEKNTIQEENDPVREKLKNLPHAKAPWYFEARLQQRIRSGNEGQGGWLFTRPLPALALSAGVFLFVCVAGYYTLVAPSSQEQQMAIPESGNSTNPSLQVVPQQERKIEALEEHVVPNEIRSGPNASVTEISIESGVHGERHQPGVSSGSLEPDSLKEDSLKSKMDSLNQKK